MSLTSRFPGPLRRFGTLAGLSKSDAGIPLRNYIDGFITSRSAATDLTIGAGQAADSGNNDYISSSAAIVKQINVDWVEGTNQGGFPSALTLAVDTWYHAFAIQNVVTGQVDGGFDTALDAANLLADATDYTRYRLIWSIKTNGSSEITDFFQHRNRGYWVDAPQILSDTTPSTTETLVVAEVPTGIQVVWIGTAVFERGGVNTVEIRSPGEDDAAAARKDLATRSSGNESGGHYERLTDTSGQIAYRSSVATADLFQIYTLGWIHPRGQE